MGSIDACRAVRIGNAMGATADLPENLANLSKRTDLDFIVGDWMSEFNMSWQGTLKASNLKQMDAVEASEGAYEVNFLESLEPALEDLARHGTKLACNAGASDTEKLYEKVVDMIAQKGLDLKVAWVEGDEVFEAMEKCRAEGHKFRNITTGQLLDAWEFEPIYAQCYLGCWGIVEAFRHGADIVVCGRVADASPTMAAAAYFHGWERQSYSELAHSLVCGHLIECSYYVTGGNFTGFKSMPKGSTPLLNLPIASIQPDGTFYIGSEERPDRGGEVSIDTCRTQLLYELQGKRYYNSDVVAIIDQIKMEQARPNSVYVHNIGFERPPPTTKVGITAKGGYQAEAHYFICGLDAEEKAQWIENQLRHMMDTTQFHTLVFTTTGSCAPNPNSQDAATMDLRVFAQSRTEAALAPPKFLKHFMNVNLSCYPGATFAMDMRQGMPKPYNEYFVTVVPQSMVNHVVHMPALGISTTIPAPEDTVEYMAEQEVEETVDPVPLESFGPTVTAPLGYVVHARSGDKGSDANVGFYVRHEDEWDWLRSLLSVQRIRELLQNSYNGKRIERFELPNIHAVHFLLKDHLDRGVSATSTYDAFGKNVSEYLRAKHVPIPTAFLARGKI